MANKMEGTFDGEVYYSSTMPKGTKDSWPYEYDKQLYNMAQNITNMDNEQLKSLQRQFIQMGLLEEGLDTGYLGKKSMGAARRYTLNTQPGVWDYIKESDLNIFK